MSNLLGNNETYILTDENKLFLWIHAILQCLVDLWTWFVVHKQLSDSCKFAFHSKPHNNSTSDESFNTNKEDMVFKRNVVCRTVRGAQKSQLQVHLFRPFCCLLCLMAQYSYSLLRFAQFIFRLESRVRRTYHCRRYLRNILPFDLKNYSIYHRNCNHRSFRRQAFTCIIH